MQALRRRAICAAAVSLLLGLSACTAAGLPPNVAAGSPGEPENSGSGGPDESNDNGSGGPEELEHNQAFRA